MTTTHEGLALGHASAEIAAAHAGSEWVRIALEAFLNFAKTHQTFTTEQVRQAFPNLPLPPDKRAWGGVARRAKVEGIAEPIDWVRADSHTVHGMVVTLWRSKVFKADDIDLWGASAMTDPRYVAEQKKLNAETRNLMDVMRRI